MSDTYFPPKNSPEYQENFDRLFVALGDVLRDHLAKGQNSQDKVFLALNALAAHSAVILAGCADRAAADFFEQCVRDQLRQIDKRFYEKGNL